MKLIRHGELNKEKPGIILDSTFYDVSAFGEDFNEQFFESGGLARLGTWVAGHKGSLKALPADGDSPRWEDVHAWVRAYSDLWTRYAPLFRTWPDLSTIDPGLVDVIRGIFTAMSGAFAEHITPDSSGHIIDADAAGLATLAMLDRFHYLREFVGQPVDDVALETITTMVYRALFDPRA